jgi:hypothetical protein
MRVSMYGESPCIIHCLMTMEARLTITIRNVILYSHTFLHTLYYTFIFNNSIILVCYDVYTKNVNLGRVVDV